MRYLFFILLVLFFSHDNSANASENRIKSDTCKPSYKEVFNFEIGDVFQYHKTSTSSAGGSNPTHEVISQYKVIGKSFNSDTISYYIHGWKKSLFFYSSSSNQIINKDTTTKLSYIDTTIVFIDSNSHFLNRCPKELIQLENELFTQLELIDIYTRIQSSYTDSSSIKTIGGQNNIFTLNTKDSLSLNNDIYYEANYKNGFGLISQKFTLLEMSESLILEGYIKNNEKFGILDKCEGFECDGSTSPTTELRSTLSDKYSIYPNPARDILYIKGDTDNILQISILDISGQKLIDNIPLSGKIDVSTLKRGLYFIRFKLSDNTSYSESILII